MQDWPFCLCYKLNTIEGDFASQAALFASFVCSWECSLTDWADCWLVRDEYTFCIPFLLFVLKMGVCLFLVSASFTIFGGRFLQRGIPYAQLCKLT